MDDSELFKFDLAGEARDTAEFLKYFKDLCYVLGGTQLVRQVHEEISYNISRGCDIAEAISYPFQAIRSELNGSI